MRKLQEEGDTPGSAGKPVQRKGKPKTGKASARAAASPAKTRARTRSTRREPQGSLPDAQAGAMGARSDEPGDDAVPPVALLPVPERSASLPHEVDLAMIEHRLQRLEAGFRLLGETLKRAFGELTRAIDSLRDDVARTATSEDLRRALTRGGLVDRISTSPDAIHAAVERLAEGIAAAQILVDEVEEAESAQDRPSAEPDRSAPEQPPTSAPPAKAVGEGQPDPAAIWGEENGMDPVQMDPGAGPRDRRRRSATRRRLEKTWPGRAYAQWKWRRT